MEEEISLVELFNIIKKRLGLIISLTLVYVSILWRKLFSRDGNSSILILKWLILCVSLPKHFLQLSHWT
ncbi:hypothetical protein IRB23M11_18760 [Alkalibacterium sp. m-11]